MAIDPIRISKHIREHFLSYLQTAFGVSERYPLLNRRLTESIGTYHRFFRGPFLQGLPPYNKDSSLSDLVRDKILPNRILDFPFFDSPDRQLYTHQVETIRRLRNGQNVALASGTGSGKTLSFIIPILAEIIENPTPGVHALLLYPMNALVNDQLKLLRRMLQSFPDITFGRYVNIEVTPEKERRGRELNPESPENEVVSRETFRKAPPHILITNYSMLEYLLLRPVDTPLFSGPWRFIVVDEAHTYRGAKGSEVALLLRRVRDRVKKAGRSLPIQYVATSATLGDNETGAFKKIQSFCSSFFGAHFGAEDIIQASTSSIPLGDDAKIISPETYSDDALTNAVEQRNWTPDLSALLVNSGFSEDDVREAEKLSQSDFDGALYQVFRNDTKALQLRNAVELVPDLFTAAKVIFGNNDSKHVQHLVNMVRIFSMARLPGTEARMVPCRYHFFVRGINGVYISFPQNGSGAENPDPYPFFEETLKDPNTGAATLQLHLCRRCKQPYAFGYDFGDRFEALGSPIDGRGLPVHMAWDLPETEFPEDEDEIGDPPTKGAQFVRWCSQCGRYWGESTSPCECNQEFRIPLWVLQRGADSLSRCPVCHGSGSITPIISEADAAQAVVTQAIYDCLPATGNRKVRAFPGRGRKLLVFSDSRQKAARFAPYLELTRDALASRWLIHRAIGEAGGDERPISADTLVDHMSRTAEDLGLYHSDDPDELRTEFKRRIIQEFCLSTGRRSSLEALATVRVPMNMGRLFAPPATLLEHGFTENEAMYLFQFFLQTIRLNKAVEMPPPISPLDEVFEPNRRKEGFVEAQGEQGGGFRLSGFMPTESRIHLQRRSSYLRRILRKKLKTETPPHKINQLMQDCWRVLTSNEDPFPPLVRVEISRGIMGFQIRWKSVRFSLENKWYRCKKCGQWSAWSLNEICPALGCDGLLERQDATKVLSDHHYRKLYTASEPPAPFTAREHTAQLSSELASEYQDAFEKGLHSRHGQINVLSCSTTFELGVDLGDLEAVLLRDVPPTPANYQQRAGRAGRGVGTAAFVTTFSLFRSHDEHYFSCPEEMVKGHINPPQLNLTNNLIVDRHVNAIILSEFVRECVSRTGGELRTIQDFWNALDTWRGDPFTSFYLKLQDDIASLIPTSFPSGYAEESPYRLIKSIREARDYFDDELAMYSRALQEARKRREQLEKNGKPTAPMTSYMDHLRFRMNGIKNTDWITFLSDRIVLPGYAFPIYNVVLETRAQEAGIKLERDLKIALSEYAPGAEIVANGLIWRSIGLRLPPNRPLPRKYYARCPKCGHVESHIEHRELFKGGRCRVCGDMGRGDSHRAKLLYFIPIHGFMTDPQSGGEKINFARATSFLPASRTYYVPQQEDEPTEMELASMNQLWISVKTSRSADFFVFNAGKNGRGFWICKSCGRHLEDAGQAHDRPWGGACTGRGDAVRLAHEFQTSVCRLTFHNTSRTYIDGRFWLSLLYSILGGMSDALGIEEGDIDGVLNPVSFGGAEPIQEVVIFDNVPGGAGHVDALAREADLRKVLESAYARVASCTRCTEETACYACLRRYGNQYCHDQLARGPVAEYLKRLLEDLSVGSNDDRVYHSPDKARFLNSVLSKSSRLVIIAGSFTDTAPSDIGSWYLALQNSVNQMGSGLVLCIGKIPDEEDIHYSAWLALMQYQGAQVYIVSEGAALAPCHLFGEYKRGGGIAIRWDVESLPVFDGVIHQKKFLYNNSQDKIAEVEVALKDWIKNNTELMATSRLSSRGFSTIPIRKDTIVDYRGLFQDSRKPGYTRIIIQDPYLQNQHQLDCLRLFLEASLSEPLNDIPVPFLLRTKLSNPTKDRFAFIPAQHRAKLEGIFQVRQQFQGALDLRGTYDKIHVRYAYFSWDDGSELLYLLDRGFDILSPGTNKAKADMFVLKFSDLDPELKAMLELPATNLG